MLFLLQGGAGQGQIPRGGAGQQSNSGHFRGGVGRGGAVLKIFRAGAARGRAASLNGTPSVYEYKLDPKKRFMGIIHFSQCG